MSRARRLAPTKPAESAYRGSEGLTAICLFSSGGIGELGLNAAGFEILIANELVPYRAALYRENFPETAVLEGDIWELQDEILERAAKLLQGRELFLLYATPPCQGMSSNGSGKLRFEIENGRRAHEDPRNRLIIPTMRIAEELQPRFVLLENVPQMQQTVIRNELDAPEAILDFVARRLGPSYGGRGEVVAAEDFGIPQRRRRLISIFSRDRCALKSYAANGGSFIHESLLLPGPTLREAIGHLPPLDAVEGLNANPEFHPQHRVPIMNPTKHWWIEHTPEGDTAFNNSCANSRCGSDKTRGHAEELIGGKWVARQDTPLYCVDCGSLLPRPSLVGKDGQLRAIKGFHSAYRRMRWDLPARTLTQNFIYEASDNKVHPSQNRVLSVYEAMILQSIDMYNYRFEIQGHDIGIPRIAEIIGESVPPRLIEVIARHLIDISEHAVRTAS